MKKFLALFLSLAMLLSMASFAVADELPTITIMFHGSNVTDDTEVLEKVNEYIADKVGAKLDVIWGTWGDFDEKAVNTLVSADSSVDMVFTCSWSADEYNTFAKNGYFLKLDDLIAEYGADLVATLPEKLMDAANCPIATFDSNYSHPNLINVISDDEKGLYLSTKYMINHGHTEIAFVADYEGNIVLTKRFNGYKKALEDSHIPFRPEYIFSYPPSYKGGVEAGRAIASGKAPITAVVTTADICAIGIMEGARLGGYRVPIDLSVIGYDNLNLCQYTVPKLTSVSQNVPKKARLATELLLKKIHDNEADCNFGEIMDVEIVDRQSVISLY